MRVRLLIDIEMPREDVTALGELIKGQPPAQVEVNPGNDRYPQVSYDGRLMGATPVEG